MTLGAGLYSTFFAAVHGFSPFPWQARLVAEIADHNAGRWPPVLGLPTSAGKTSTIDVAVFLLALEASRPLHERQAPLRIFFVVDRRIVVDEAGLHAEKVRDLLNAARPGNDAAIQAIAAQQRGLSDGSQPLSNAQLAVLMQVAERLRSFSGSNKSLHIGVLRGGMYRDGSWAEVPNQPTICLSTVDQIGSRLLFRGYGVSEHQRAVHAGLVGNDSLIIVDEAHLSNPLLQTLKAINRFRGDGWAEQSLRTPFQVVVMSATVQGASAPFVLDDVDREDPVLKARLEASKRARLETVDPVKDDEPATREQFASRIVEAAKTLAGIATAPEPTKRKGRKESVAEQQPSSPPVQVVGIVVNRVDTARRIHSQLLAQPKPESPEFDVILLTGRVRPYDRDDLLFRKRVGEHQGWLKFMEAARERPTPPSGKLFVVATQTIEVGANLSFDALVTELAPLDALRQRFGRLDRLGIRKVSEAVVIARKDTVATRAEPDPVYGLALMQTWQWLKALEKSAGKERRIDFGIHALPVPADPKELQPLCSPRPDAPVMLPAHVETWVQTTPTPVPDPDINLFLHGPESGPADVNIVWRADLAWHEDGHDISLLERDERSAIDVVSLVPPTSMEAMPVPVWAAHRWLRGKAEADVPDVEGSRADREQRSRSRSAGNSALRWFGPDDDRTQVIRPDEIEDEIRPGDTIIVPSTYGGSDAFGWNPACKDLVRDVADDCSWRARRRPVLRVHKQSRVQRFAAEAWSLTPNEAGETFADALAAVLPRPTDDDQADWKGVEDCIKSWPNLPEWWQRAFGSRRRKLIQYPEWSGLGAVFVLPFQRPPRDEDETEDDAPPAGDESSLTATGEPITLNAHCEGVRGKLRCFTDSLKLDPAFGELLGRAALLHDAGKADDRFQLRLHGGDERAWLRARAPLAKSPQLDARDRAADRAARRKARWPLGARHEALPSSWLRAVPLRRLAYAIASFCVT
jgi:CRISPR-associated endonuclease/helicase Cas3